VARDSDIQHVQKSVEILRRQNMKMTTEWQHAESHLLTLASTTNLRLETLKGMIMTQRHTVEKIFNDVINETQNLTEASNLITAAFEQIRRLCVTTG